jgi:tetratricopeptide (TPR) repeat protein
MSARVAIELLEARGDEASFAQAIRALDADLAMGESPGLLLERGYVHEMRGTSEIREAIRWYERALELDPSFAKAHYQLVGAYVALGQAHDAIARYEHRIADAPGDLVAHRCLAHAYVAAGRWDDARATIEAGRRLAPDDVILLDVEGSLLAGTGRADEALAAWQRALELDTTSIGGHYSRAFLFERLGRLAEAEAEWEAIIAWSRARGNDLDTEWPLRELARLRGSSEGAG